VALYPKSEDDIDKIRRPDNFKKLFNEITSWLTTGDDVEMEGIGSDADLFADEFNDKIINQLPSNLVDSSTK